MDILFESTQAFENHLNKLNSVIRDEVIGKINACAQEINAANYNQTVIEKSFYALPLPFDSSEYPILLYIFNVSDKLRIILTLDADPIFDQFIFTLFDVVGVNEVLPSYKRIAALIYQELSPERNKNTSIVEVQSVA